MFQFPRFFTVRFKVHRGAIRTEPRPLTQQQCTAGQNRRNFTVKRRNLYGSKYGCEFTQLFVRAHQCVDRLNCCENSQRVPTTPSEGIKQTETANDVRTTQQIDLDHVRRGGGTSQRGRCSGTIHRRVRSVGGSIVRPDGSAVVSGTAVPACLVAMVSASHV